MNDYEKISNTDTGKEVDKQGDGEFVRPPSEDIQRMRELVDENPEMFALPQWLEDEDEKTNSREVDMRPHSDISEKSDDIEEIREFLRANPKSPYADMMREELRRQLGENADHNDSHQLSDDQTDADPIETTIRTNGVEPHSGIEAKDEDLEHVVEWRLTDLQKPDPSAAPEMPTPIEAEETWFQPAPKELHETVLERGDTWPDRSSQISDTTSRIEYGEAEDIFKRVQIRGDGRAGELTPELIEHAGLMPHHRLEIEGRTMWFSHGYDIGRGRAAVLGYVQDDDGSVVARSYYRSNSQGVWRYLPQYQMQEGRVSWYSKGYGEESLTLPATLQESLTNSIEDDGGILELDADIALAAFIGTARHIGSEGTVYHDKVSPSPESLRGIPEYGGVALPSPETVRVDNEQSPKFNTVLASWQQETSLYGRVTFEAIPSNDGTLRYLFCRDERGRAWVSGVENNSPVESTGLRQQWISGGVLTTPAYEYSQQAAGYGNEQDRRGSYVDMFELYLSKIPIIQEYITSKEERSES